MWFLNCRSQPIGGDVTPVRITDGALSYPTFPQLLTDIRGKHVLIGIHGFNVAQAGGIDHLQQWNKLLTLSDQDIFLGGLWPGDSTWLGAVEYAFAAKAAMRSGDTLADFINREFTQALSISFVSHSLGARVALRTIQQLSANFTVRRLIMMAPAIDDDCLTKEFGTTSKRIGSVSILASEKDKVLMLAYPLGNPISGIFAQGHPYYHAALGRQGPKNFPAPNNIEAGWLLPSSWQVDHSDYLPPQSPFPVGLQPTPFPVPVNFPAYTASAPYPGTPTGYIVNNVPMHWQCGWTASITSTRFR
jgi:hypothetical protein